MTNPQAILIKPAVFTDLKPLDSRAVQTALISIGCRWLDSSPTLIKHIDMPCISVESNGTLHYHYHNRTLRQLGLTQ